MNVAVELDRRASCRSGRALFSDDLIKKEPPSFFIHLWGPPLFPREERSHVPTLSPPSILFMKALASSKDPGKAPQPFLGGYGEPVRCFQPFFIFFPPFFRSVKVMFFFQALYPLQSRLCLSMLWFALCRKVFFRFDARRLTVVARFPPNSRSHGPPGRLGGSPLAASGLYVE